MEVGNLTNAAVEESSFQPRRVTPQGVLPQGAPPQGVSPQGTFAETLSEINFSKHAATRLNSRELNLTREQISRVEDGVNRLKQRGVRDSLVLVDGAALVVNVGSGTVVTAVGKEKRLFTNIDGAVIV